MEIIRVAEIPPHRKGRKAKYPFAHIEVGEGFYVDSLAAARSAYACALKRGMRACWRKLAEDQYLVTRIE